MLYRRWTCEELISELRISDKSVHRILTEELKMCKRFAPRYLT